jgi:D-aminoacyl-tRNA deacylase
MILIVASTCDTASMNIRQQLLTHYHFEESGETFHTHPVYVSATGDDEVRLITIDEEPIYSQAITTYLTPQRVLYLSRHSSRSGTPTLSVHTPGNLDRAEKGGLSRKVSIAPANALRKALLTMAKQKDERGLSYKVSYEGTHHGPSLDVPTMFVELGSSPTEWKDEEAAEAVADAAMAATSDHFSPSQAVVGIGGPHYNKKFTQIALDQPMAFGHIVPKYAVSQLTAKMVQHCVERTEERVEEILLDWKGIKGQHKARLVEALEQVRVPARKV